MFPTRVGVSPKATIIENKNEWYSPRAWGFSSGYHDLRKRIWFLPHVCGRYAAAGVSCILDKSIFLFSGGIPFYAFNTNGNRGIPHLGGGSPVYAAAILMPRRFPHVHGGIPRGIACGLKNLQISPRGWG